MRAPELDLTRNHIMPRALAPLLRDLAGACIFTNINALFSAPRIAAPVTLFASESSLLVYRESQKSRPLLPAQNER